MTADLSTLVSTLAAGIAIGKGDGYKFPGTDIFPLFVWFNSEMRT